MNLYGLFSASWAEATAWALVHSLWQGALVAALLGAGLFLARKSTAHLRYLLSLGALVLMMGAFSATWIIYFEPETAFVAGTSPVVRHFNFTAQPPVAVVSTASFSTYLRMLAPWLSLLWVLGVALLATRGIGSWLYLKQLGKSTVQGPEVATWQQKLNALSSKMGIDREVGLKISSRSLVPMVMGHLRPVIFLPIGLLTQMPAAQIEAILAHELAHIRRWDFLINLLQTMVDWIFFYHPAIWWISSRVREERECSCDDIAVAVCGNQLVYAHALAGVATFQQSVSLALAATGPKGKLLYRIRRLVSPASYTQTGQVRSLGWILVVVFAFFFTWWAPVPASDGSLSGALAAFRNSPIFMTLPFRNEGERRMIPMENKGSSNNRQNSGFSFEGLHFVPQMGFLYSGVDTPPPPPPVPLPIPPGMPAPPPPPTLPAPPPPPAPPKKGPVEDPEGFKAWEKEQRKWEIAQEAWSREYEAFMEKYGEEMERWSEGFSQAMSEQMESSMNFDEGAFDKQMEELERQLEKTHDHAAYERNVELLHRQIESANHQRALTEDQRESLRDAMQDMAERQRDMAQDMAERQREMAQDQAEWAREYARNFQHQNGSSNYLVPPIPPIPPVEPFNFDFNQNYHFNLNGNEGNALKYILQEELVNDGLISSRKSSVKLSLKDGEIKVNGKDLKGNTLRKYQDILRSQGISTANGTSMNLQYDFD